MTNTQKLLHQLAATTNAYIVSDLGNTQVKAVVMHELIRIIGCYNAFHLDAALGMRSYPRIVKFLMILLIRFVMGPR